MSLSDLQDTIDDLLCHTCQDAARMSAVLNRARRMEYNHASVHALQAKLSVLVAESPPGASTFDLGRIRIDSRLSLLFLTRFPHVVWWQGARGIRKGCHRRANRRRMAASQSSWSRG